MRSRALVQPTMRPDSPWRRWFIPAGALLLLLACANWAHAVTGAEVLAGIHPDRHPRVFIDSLDVAQQRVYAKSYLYPNNKMMKELRSYWTSYHTAAPTNTDRALGVCRYFFWQDSLHSVPTFVTECTTAVGHVFDTNEDCGWKTGDAMEGGDWGRTSIAAELYDIMYGWLNATRRRACWRKLAAALHGSRCEDASCAPPRHTNFKAAILLSIVGDSADVGFNAEVADTIAANLSFFEDYCAPCWEQLDQYGFNEQYYGIRHTAAMANIGIATTAFGYSGPLLLASKVTDGFSFHQHMQRTGLYTDANGKKYSQMGRGPSKWDADEFTPLRIAAWHGKYGNDEHAWSWAQYLLKRNIDTGSATNQDARAQSAVVLYWHDPTRYSETHYLWKDTPKYIWNYPGYGVFNGRESWGIDSTGVTQTSTSVMYYFGAANALGHKNALHYNIMRGNDNLAFDSGYRLVDPDDHIDWYSTVMAHNVPFVIQASESPGTLSTTDGGLPACATSTFTRANGGGQIEGATAPGSTWDACDYGGVGRPTYRGVVTEQEMSTTHGLYRVAGNADSAYVAAKKRYVRRSWTWDGGDVVLVWDQVRTKGTVVRAGTRLHTVNAPMFQRGAIEVLRGGGISGAADSVRVDADGGAYGDTHGGIYKITGCSVMDSAGACLKSDNGTSRLWTFPLEVRNVTAVTDGYIHAIGGPNRAHEHWRQTENVCAENTWESTSGPSFEFWVPTAGVVTVGRNLVPGTHAKGASCATTFTGGDGVTTCYRNNISSNAAAVTQAADIDVRNNRTGRGFGHGADACDWYTEMVVDSPADGDVCEFIYVDVARSTSDSQPAVKYTHSGEVLAVAVDDLMLVETSASVFSRQSSLSWSNPLTTENCTIKVAGLAASSTYALLHDGAQVSTVTTDAEGVTSWAHTANGVSEFTLQVTAAGAIPGAYRLLYNSEP